MAEPAGLPSQVFTSRPVRVVLCLLALGALAETIPGLSRVRIFSGHARSSEPGVAAPPKPIASGETTLDERTETRSDLAQPENLGAVPRAAGPIAQAPGREMAPETPEGTGAVLVDRARSLERFFASLAHADRKESGAVSRIVYFGDSVVASDFGTGTLRRLLQDRFGDAGHGFMLVASAWPQYFHNDVSRLADSGFRVSRIVGPRAEDGLYGLGGVSFTGAPGLRARVGTAKSGTHGLAVSSFDVSYLEQPGGGTLQASIDGVVVRSIDTNGSEKHAAFARLETTDGPHELELLTGRGSVRMFGVAMERSGPGVVLDAIGVVGARLRTLDEGNDQDFASALARRHPNLVAYQFGANESGDGFAYSMEDYHRTMKAFLGKVAAAAPDAGCLVVGAMDRARKEDDRLVTVPVIPHIVEEQRKVAEEVGCAFFDTYRKMGGKGSMAAWVKQGLGAGDYTHPTSWGAERLGTWIYAALLERYDAYRREAADAPGAGGTASPSATPATSAPSSP